MLPTTTIDDRTEQWERRRGVLEGVIERAKSRRDVQFAIVLCSELEDLEDRRCDDCGRFEDDPNDLHAEWCRWSKTPRPSLDYDSEISISEQVRQVLATLGEWGDNERDRVPSCLDGQTS